MTNSLNKAFTAAIALALIVIAVGRIPFSREKELTNLCREYYTMYLNQNDYSLNEKKAKIKVIANKTGLKARGALPIQNNFKKPKPFFTNPIIVTVRKTARAKNPVTATWLVYVKLYGRRPKTFPKSISINKVKM